MNKEQGHSTMEGDFLCPHPLDNAQYKILEGQYCRLEVLNCKTNENVVEELFNCFKSNENVHFQYLKYGPFETIDEFKDLIYKNEQANSKTVMYTIFVKEQPMGFICFARIQCDQGTIAISGINFSQQLVRTREATESIYLLLTFAFDTLGYRRVEWRCNALNVKSRQSAKRFGFQYEGTWLKATISKGEIRDDAWHSIIDDEWILLKQEYQRWLNPINFDHNGQQLSKLNAAQINPRKQFSDKSV